MFPVHLVLYPVYLTLGGMDGSSLPRDSLGPGKWILQPIGKGRQVSAKLLEG